MKYQLIVLGPNQSQYSALLGANLEKHFESLGLMPVASYLQKMTEQDAAGIDWKGNPVGVWLGGASSADPNHLQVLRQLLDNDAPVLPLVDDVSKFSSLVPHDPDLRPINGRQWTDDRAVTDILHLMRLTRDERQAFISYRRSDAQAVANQIFDALGRRGYRAFLDTASVEGATRFQDVLHGRLADMDLLIFLDSSTACESQWVIDELTLANNLGLTVLQLVWPGKKPFSGAALAKPFVLDRADFVGQNAIGQDTLADPALERILSNAESLRVESLGYRRRRVVGELVDSIGAHQQLRAIVRPIGPVELRDASNDDFLAWAVPLIGVPTDRALRLERSRLAALWEELGRDMAKLEAESERFRVIYDGLGVDRHSHLHLKWLNEYLPLRTLHLDRERTQGQSPIDEWLAKVQEEVTS